MTAAVLGLAGTLLVVIGGVVTTLVTRKPNQVENQVANDGHWEAITGGWKEQAAFLRAEVVAMRGTVVDLQGKVEALEDVTERDGEWKTLAISYFRALLGWGHDAGLVDPPDPPNGLVIPKD